MKRTGMLVLLFALLNAWPGATARPLHELDPAAPDRHASARPPLSAGLFFDPSRRTLCEIVENSARVHDLPVDYFARLIRAESAFDAGAVSPKGAQGIAQFMPGTADLRGLDDPFDPVAAIDASAHFLADLRAQFGNLGLAAAAYNAGPTRVTDWIAGARGLPLETLGYVYKVTGHPADAWLATGEERPELPDALSCAEIASGAGQRKAAKVAGAVAPRAPWGAQVAGNYSLPIAMATYRRLQRSYPRILSGVAPSVVSGRLPGRGKRAFHRVQVPAGSRGEAQRICDRLRAAGGSCIVQANR